MTDYSDSVTPSCPLRSPSLPDYPSPFLPSPWLPLSQPTLSPWLSLSLAVSRPAYPSLPAYPNNPPSTFS